jgi:hypothetical protein
MNIRGSRCAFELVRRKLLIFLTYLWAKGTYRRNEYLQLRIILVAAQVFDWGELVVGLHLELRLACSVAVLAVTHEQWRLVS